MLFSVDFHDNTVGQTSQQVNPETGVELEWGAANVLISRAIISAIWTYAVYVAMAAHGRRSSTMFKSFRNIADGLGTTGGGGSNAGAFNAWNAADASGTYSNFTIENNTIYGRYKRKHSMVSAVWTPLSAHDQQCWRSATTSLSGFPDRQLDMWGAIAGATVGTVGINNNDFNGNGNSNAYKTQITLVPTNVTNVSDITTDPLFVNAPAGNLPSSVRAVQRSISERTGRRRWHRKT